MTVASGNLNQRVQIQARSQSRDSSTGAVTFTWATITNGDDWAAIEPMSARELLAAAAAQSKVSARIRMRYRADVTGSMRIVHNGDVYNIEGVARDPVSGLEWMTLSVSLGVNQGA